MKVIVVGGGIAGLAIGWRLAQAGATVEVYDRGLAGRGATWAAAGMIAPGAELHDEPDALARFARISRAAWPAFAAELEAESGCSIGYSEPGSLILASSETQASALEARARRVENSEWLTGSRLLIREPLLSPALHGALFVPGDAHVDNRRTADALRAALARRSVPVHENVEVRGLIIDGERVRGVVCAGGAVSGDAVVVAAGAWLNALRSVPVDLPPVSPVKGQMLAVQPLGAASLPKHLLWSEDAYLVARADRLLIGATVEDVGFDTSVSKEACEALVAAAARLVPAIAGWRVEETWAGLRPRTPDGAPVLGAAGIDGLYLAGGQFRNGILFAAAIAAAMTRAVLTARPVPEIESFSPRRFNVS